MLIFVNKINYKLKMQYEIYNKIKEYRNKDSNNILTQSESENQSQFQLQMVPSIKNNYLIDKLSLNKLVTNAKLELTEQFKFILSVLYDRMEYDDKLRVDLEDKVKSVIFDK